MIIQRMFRNELEDGRRTNYIAKIYLKGNNKDLADGSIMMTRKDNKPCSKQLDDTEYFISIQMFRLPLLLPDGNYQSVKQEFINTYSSYREMKNMYWTIMNKYGFHKKKYDKKRKV